PRTISTYLNTTVVLLPSLSGELSDSPRKRGPVALGRARAAWGREHAGPWQARSAARRCEGTSSQEPPQQRRRTSLGRRPGLSFVGSRSEEHTSELQSRG